MTIPSSRSLIFEVKSTGSELPFIRVLRLRFDSFAFGRLRTSSENFGRLRKSSDFFGNDRVVFKNPSTPRIKISRLYLRKSWQVQVQWSISLSHSCIGASLLIPSLLVNCTLSSLAKSPNQCCKLSLKSPVGGG